jgi:hypothetical protein
LQIIGRELRLQCVTTLGVLTTFEQCRELVAIGLALHGLSRRLAAEQIEGLVYFLYARGKYTFIVRVRVQTAVLEFAPASARARIIAANLHHTSPPLPVIYRGSETE